MDDRQDVNPEVMELLHDFSQRTEHGLYILPGNRDFYLNADFAERTGARLLQEPVLLALDDQHKALLLHGDTLCSKDISYQRYRRLVTCPWTRRSFMALPLFLRRAITRRARRALREYASRKPPRMTDVDPDTVHRQMQQHGVRILIHGHTHRPMIHRFALAGQKAQRIVLGDWYQGDSVLVWQDGRGELLTVDQCLARRQFRAGRRARQDQSRSDRKR